MAARWVAYGVPLGVALLVGAIGAGASSGCGNKSNGFPDEPEAGDPGSDDGSPATSGSSGGAGSGGSGNGSGSGSGTGGSSSGKGSGSSSGSTSGSGSSSRDSGNSSGDQKVPSNVQYNDAGVVLCGTPCPLTSNVCCIDVLGNGHCMPPGSTCTNEAVFKCVERTDCPTNEICCGIADQTTATAGSECQDVASTNNQCTPVATSASSTQGSAQLCQTNAECLTGTCIWQDCTVGTLKPSLTFCGLQSAAPFNCVAHQ
jgi:hypothetical protein